MQVQEYDACRQNQQPDSLVDQQGGHHRSDPFSISLVEGQPELDLIQCPFSIVVIALTCQDLVARYLDLVEQKASQVKIPHLGIDLLLGSIGPVPKDLNALVCNQVFKDQLVRWQVMFLDSPLPLTCSLRLPLGGRGCSRLRADAPRIPCYRFRGG